MNKEMKYIVDTFNERQDKYHINENIQFENIASAFYHKIFIKLSCLSIYMRIGFYEFLVNPEYKAFEVLGLQPHIMYNDSIDAKRGITIKQPEEIIKYMYEVLKNG